LPEVVDPQRKAKAASDFRYFCESYFPLTFHLAWSTDHLKVITRIEQAVLRGGLFSMAMPRGSGKTTICECACIWAVLNGHREFVCLIGSDEGHAMDMLDSIKMELDGNDLLLEDYPEVVFPIQALDGIANRCNGQLYQGHRTHIGWTAREVVLPTIPGSVGSGAIIKVAGITGRIRGMKYKRSDGQTMRPSLVVIDDPQNDFLSPDGVAWGVVGESVTENGTVEHLEALFRAAARYDVPVFVSPHYYFPHDHHWKFEGALEHLMHDIKMFDRPGQLDTTGLDGSGADWLDRYKPYISGRNVVVTSPHKVYGPESNDLVLQLRKRGISKVILGGMSANLCTESHMRELIEQGFEVTVVEDATAGAKTPAGDAHKVAVANYHYIASAVVTTDEAVAAIEAAFGTRKGR
jgi:nicotinamidase-related amidase